MKHVVAFLLALLAIDPSSAQEKVWPDKDWAKATPASQGLGAEGLDAAAAYAEKHGGGSGCIIRHGFLVKEWGSTTARADIKSATKGSFGATMLGLAVDAGVVKLEDLARKHYQEMGAEKKENVDAGWLDEITIHQLATMTAGFDDGRPPKLVYRPGTKGIYSNDTSNMLAELLTLRFKQDLAPLMKSKVMDKVGVAAGDWAWRENSFRPRTIQGIKSREFASGITITHRALARIGYLYLREGKWKDERILSKEFIKTATEPTTLPAPWPYYAFYWGSNAKRTFKDIPKDAYWALGLGDSFVLVCPSLDIVAVRLGVGSAKSQLPGGDDWGLRVAKFFKHVVEAVQPTDKGKPTEIRKDDKEFPSSKMIKSIVWSPPETILRHAKGSDIWPMTWGDDDALYTAYGDGWGFDPKLPDKLSMGFAKVTGLPPDLKGSNIRSLTGEDKGDGKRGKKPSGILMIDGVLYLWVRNAGNAVLGWSADQGKTWTFSAWELDTSFGCPTFLNFGKNYGGALDDYVYIYSQDVSSAYEVADQMVLARVPKNQLKKREAYEFFKKLDAGTPIWTKDVKERGPVLSRPGKCYRSGVSFNAGLGRYLWCQTLPRDTKPAQYGLAIYDGPTPWGPWTQVLFEEKWDVDAGESCSFPTRWMSADGRTLYLVFSGNDSFSVRKATLEPYESKRGDKGTPPPAFKRRTLSPSSTNGGRINGKQIRLEVRASAPRL